MFSKLFFLIYRHQLFNKEMEEIIKVMIFHTMVTKSPKQKHNLLNFLKIFCAEFNLIRRKHYFAMTDEIKWLLAITFEELQKKSE